MQSCDTPPPIPGAPKECPVCRHPHISAVLFSKRKRVFACACQKPTKTHTLDFYNDAWMPTNKRARLTKEARKGTSDPSSDSSSSSSGSSKSSGGKQSTKSKESVGKPPAQPGSAQSPSVAVSLAAPSGGGGILVFLMAGMAPELESWPDCVTQGLGWRTARACGIGAVSWPVCVT